MSPEEVTLEDMEKYVKLYTRQRRGNLLTCSHSAAIHYFESSLDGNLFWSKWCVGTMGVLWTCDDRLGAYMGIQAKPTLKKMWFYTKVRSEYPYGYTPQDLVDLHIAKNGL